MSDASIRASVYAQRRPGEEEDGVVWKSLYSGLIVIVSVALALVAFVLTVTVRV